MNNIKVDKAIRLLQSFKGKEIELSFSGGKDSCVILELAKMAKIPYRAIYKNTTIDPPGTIKFCKDMGVEIIEPKDSFFDLIKKSGFPTRRARFCCSHLKEYKILADSIQGIRKCESAKRNAMYSEPIKCRIYGSRKNHANVYLPILEWTDKDVADFIEEYHIKCHPLYSKDGKFDVKERLGCMGCPLQGDKGLSDFKKNPKLVKAWIRAGQIWWNKPRDKIIGSKIKFANIYELFVHNVFYNSYSEFYEATHGMFGTLDCKKFLEEYFNMKL